jgi:thioredoxin reductase (NADPH)
VEGGAPLMPEPQGPFYDALVLGGGPAGLATALQLARSNRRVVVFDGADGRATYHQVNHNYLGFPGGIEARDLLDLARKQVREYPVAFVSELVARVRRDGSAFEALDEIGRSYRGRTITFATGVRDHFPLFPDWEQYVGRSLFWCIVCDGYSTRGKRLIIAGNDTDAGVTALQFLQFTSRVTLVTNAPICGLNERICAALEEHGVPMIVGEIAGVRGTDGIIGTILLKDGRALELDFLFSLQGQSPNTDLAAGIGVALSPEGYILIDENQQTNLPGVFAAGDVTRAYAHQISTAVHEGNTAATAVNYYLYDAALKHETYRD